jgi:glycosyltransferase involved in cell wall biosynthesis
MANRKELKLSVVVPVFNEGASLKVFNAFLTRQLDQVAKDNYEVLYCDDGSTDKSAQLIKQFAKDNKRIRLIKLSRNFGKEIATTAGIHAAGGQAIITVDADGQHPIELIPKFLAKWHKGAKVVIGVRTGNQKEGLVKRYGSKLFYKIFNRFTQMKLLPGATDFRLIDKAVQQQFIKMTERNRITRGLIDWLGYDREYIKFKANPRSTGEASYSFKKLFKLAVDSIISLSLSPLYIAAYIGAVILPLAFLLGLLMIINAIVHDPWNLDITGSAYLMVLVLFLVGVLLLSQGIIGLYLSHIHTETQNRPLYVVDEERSIRQ